MNENVHHNVIGIELAVGQLTEMLLFDGEALSALLVTTGDHVFNEVHVFFAAGEVTAGSQQQRLVDDIFEVTIGRFDIAVLVGTAGVGLLRRAAVVIHQCRVATSQ